jgi:hypothetical protein
MRSNWIGAGVLLTITVAAGACVEARTRPLTGVDDGPFDPDGPPLVSITHPQEGQVFFKDVWTSGSGVQVTYAGEFPAGHELRLLAYLDFEQFPSTQPFFKDEFTIDEHPATAIFVRGLPDQFREAIGVTLLLEIHDTRGIRISVDSVSTTVR